MSKRIAIVGASVRAAAASAVRAGFSVAAADLFADEDLREIADATRIRDYPDGLAVWLSSLSPRPAGWLYTGALENRPELVDLMSDIAPLWGNTGDVLRQIRSPWLLSEALQDADLHFPAIRASPDGLPRDGSWLVKTGRGASGSGVAVLVDAAVGADTFFQQRVSGVPCSAVFAATGGKSELLGIVRQLVGETWLHARAFQYCGAIGPRPVSPDTHQEIRRIGQVLTTRFALRGLFGVDFILDGNRVWTIEVNPRYPASAEVIEWATGVSMLATHAEASHSSSFAAAIAAERKAMFGKAILFARRDVEIIVDLRRLSQEIARGDGSPALADVPGIGTHVVSTHPVLTLFAGGNTTDEIMSNLKARVAIVKRQLYVH